MASPVIQLSDIGVGHCSAEKVSPEPASDAIDTPLKNDDTTQVSGWGRYPVVSGRIKRSENLEAITQEASLTRGLGRSYGDSSLPAKATDTAAVSTLADRILSFDREEGWLRAEAGLSLLELNRLYLAQGWFTPVTPGTQYVTLGGMVAADIHGKNHHLAGCFGEHVRSLKIRVADGRVIDCSDQCEPELFRATIGGMGLTGHILEVEFKMEKIASPWIWGESERVANIDEFIEGLKQAAKDWPFTVGWIDCLSRGRNMGRGILIKGRWAQASEAPETPPKFKKRARLPIEMPSWVLSPLTVKAFNFLYYWKHWRKVQRGIAHPQAFFYPLDALEDWNLMYGKTGFTQYQCILPHHPENRPTRAFLDLLTSKGGSSFLCVIKDFGVEGKGMISFPKPGVTIALDVPIRSGKTEALVQTLNELVIAEGGRIYLAKDAFTEQQDFEKMDERLEAWQAVRRKWDPEGILRSAQSVRLLGDLK